MRGDPRSYVRKRFGAAIDWRVRDRVAVAVDDAVATRRNELDAQRAVDAGSIETLGKLIADTSATLTEQQRALTTLLEQLDRRVTALEQRS